MKNISQSFKENIKEMGRGIDAKITYSLDGQKIELENEELNSIKPVYQGALLKSIMKELYIDSNIDIPLGTIINFKFGINLDNGPFEYINFGNYIVYSSEKQEDTNSYNIVCYDRMLASMVEYEELQTDIKTFPMTVRDYIDCISADLGLFFKNKNEVFANYNRIIESDLYADLEYTYRDILDELAQVTASNIVINENDELEIRYITSAYETAEASSDNNNIVIIDDDNIGYRKITVNDKNDVIKEIKVNYATGYDTIDEEYLKDVNVKFGEKYGPINSIVLSRAGESDNVYLQDEESVEKNGLCEIKISENQIMNFNDRSDYLPDILDKLNGLEYYINDFSSTGICYYEICDKYNVKIGDEIYQCVMLNDEITIESGLIENIYTDLPEESVTDYTKSDKTDRRINQTYLIVDKQNQTIEGVVSQVDGQNEKITRVEQTVDSISSTVKDLQYDIQEGGFVTQTEMSSAIKQSADNITSSVTKTVTEAKQEAIDSANATTDNKLKDYSTTTEMNSAISQSASSINASVSQKITDAEGNILNEVDGKLDLYIAKGDTDEVISALNVAVNQLIINADNFKLDKNGNIEFKDGIAHNLSISGGGSIILDDTGALSEGEILVRSVFDNDRYSIIRAGELAVNDSKENFYASIGLNGIVSINEYGETHIQSGHWQLFDKNSERVFDFDTQYDQYGFLKPLLLDYTPDSTIDAVPKWYADQLNLKYTTYDFANAIGSYGGTQYLNLPENTVFIEPIIELEGGTCNGTFLRFGAGFTYIICNNTTTGTYTGIYCRCMADGTFTVSDYMHCGKNVIGVRAWHQ